MLSLLKNDLKRILKDKLFFITLIVCVALSVMTPLMYKGLFMLGDLEDMLGMYIDSKTVFFQSFSPSNNVGLIAPILIGIILYKDYSYGTIRNKIISGNSRSSIFLSSLIATIIVLCSIVILQALLALFVSLIFFPYHATPYMIGATSQQTVSFTAGDFGYLLLSVLFEILIYILVSAIVCFLCASVKNVGLVIVGYIGVNLLFTIIGAIVSVALSLSQDVNPILEFLANINIFTSTIIGSGSTYSLKELLYSVLTPVIGTTLLIVLSVLIFNKKDLK